MTRKRRHLTKTELIAWLETELALGNGVTVPPDDFDIRDFILETHFEVDRSDHQAYRLVVDRVKDGTWDWSVDTPPELHYEVSVADELFEIETNYVSLRDGEYEWKAEWALETGEGAEAYGDVDAKLRELLRKYATPELPCVDNCDLPSEGVSWDLLASSLNSLVLEGAELYGDGETVKVMYLGDDEADFDGYRRLSSETDAASVLDESLEYELDWSMVQRK